MNRRTAITAAGTVALVVAAASAAIGANVGILRTADASDGVGTLNPAAQQVPQTTPADPQVETVYVDDVVHVPGSTPATESSPSTTAATDPSFGSSPAVGHSDGASSVNDDSLDHADDSDDDEEDEEHEGAEDDD